MTNEILIDAVHQEETRIAVIKQKRLENYDYEFEAKKPIRGNIYLAKVIRVEPSLQAAFLDYGGNRNAFLPFSEINSDYYQIPASDKEKLKELEKEEKKKESESIKEEKKKESDEPDNIGGDELDEIDSERKKSKRIKYKIQEVIKKNQIILVQVLKDEKGFKGAALSTFISIAGKYIVLMPNTAKGGGISRKIFNPGERKKIRVILNEIEVPKEMGIIVRTAGLNKTKNEINNDLKNLISIWNSIKENAMNAIAPTLIHQESDIIKRSIRDMYDDGTQSIIVEGNEGYQKAKNYMKLMF